MKIRNVTESEVRAALAAVAALYAGNVKGSEVVAASAAAKKGTRGAFRVRLGVESSKRPGARRSASGRRLAVACWHAFGHFFDALPACALIDGAVGEKSRPAGADWQDRNIGPTDAPVMFSETCDCAATGHAARRLSPVTSGSGPSWVTERVAPLAKGAA